MRSVWRISCYDDVRQGRHFYYQYRIKTVEIAAVAECENQYLNYGDPENQEENGRRSGNAQQARQQQDLLDIANGEVGLLAAANNDDLATVQAYISSGADVDMMSSDGSSTPLHNAVTRGSTEMARMLLAAGADPNVSTTDDFKTTPLGEAAGKGNAEMIKTLIAGGADTSGVAGSRALNIEEQCWQLALLSHTFGNRSGISVAQSVAWQLGIKNL